MIPSPDDRHAPAEILAGCGPLAREMLEQHIPDADRMCEGCRQLGQPAAYPCRLRGLAAEALVLQAQWRASLRNGWIPQRESPDAMPYPEPDEYFDDAPYRDVGQGGIGP